MSRLGTTIAVFLAICGSLAFLAACTAKPSLKYPHFAKGPVVDVYHGVEVPDPYRDLEQADTPATRAWVQKQQRLTQDYLDAVPGRSQLQQRVQELWRYEKFGTPKAHGPYVFYTHNPGLLAQPQLLVAPRSDLRNARVLLDINTFSQDGTTALAGWSVSPDGKFLAYALSGGGSDWNTWHVRDVESGKDLADKVEWAKFSDASWDAKGEGFYYSRYPRPKADDRLSSVNQFHQVYYHKRATPQSHDILVFESSKAPKHGFSAETTEDGKYLVITTWQGTDNRYQVHVLDVSQGPRGSRGSTVAIAKTFEAGYTYIGNRGPLFWFETNHNAPRGKVVRIDLRQPQPKHWTTVIPQAKQALRSVSWVGGKLFANYLQDARSVVRMFSPKGRSLGQLTLPGMGTIYPVSGKMSAKEGFVAYTSFAQPTTIYKVDVKTGAASAVLQPKLAFAPKDFVTTQHFVTSKDGTRFPIFISHHKDVQPGPQRQTYLYGYGGFNIAITPRFNVGNMAWMDMGGVFVSANIRGGGEYGEAWHKAGTKLNKQNVFDDFIAAAEYLVEEKLTSPAKLAIGGRSNGGLLVGACLTQRPDLFAAAFPAVGVLDMIRFPQFTVGWAWMDDYGDPDEPEEFKALLAYSPLHNIRAGTAYPATLIMTADHDDRVVPAHSFKFGAALQEAQGGKAPTLLRIETRAGHGRGKSTQMRMAEVVDQWSFAATALKFDLGT